MDLKCLTGSFIHVVTKKNSLSICICVSMRCMASLGTVCNHLHSNRASTIQQGNLTIFQRCLACCKQVVILAVYRAYSLDTNLKAHSHNRILSIKILYYALSQNNVINYCFSQKCRRTYFVTDLTIFQQSFFLCTNL